jgi:hypothetical protein
MKCWTQLGYDEVIRPRPFSALTGDLELGNAAKPRRSPGIYLLHLARYGFGCTARRID